MSPMPSDGVTGNICPAEHYCPSGSTSPLVCPDGTYSNTTGVKIYFIHLCYLLKLHHTSYKIQALIYSFLILFLIK